MGGSNLGDNAESVLSDNQQIDSSLIFTAEQSRFNDFTTFVGFIQRTRQPY